MARYDLVKIGPDSGKLLEDITSIPFHRSKDVNQFTKHMLEITYSLQDPMSRYNTYFRCLDILYV